MDKDTNRSDPGRAHPTGAANGEQSASGRPGGGRGRRDEAGGSGVFPASGPEAPADAELHARAGWGQGERGAAGYEDSGPSELKLSEAEIRAAEQGRGRSSGERGGPGE